MTLTLDLSPDLEQRLMNATKQLGVPALQFIQQLLDKHLPKKNNRAEVISILQSWVDEADEAEQKETGNYLFRVLDEDRLSDRKLFPSELRGVTW